MNIVNINTHDKVGGSARVSLNLFRSYRRLGHNSKLMVGYKSIDDPDIIQITPKWQRSAGILNKYVTRLRWLRRPRELMRVFRGYENFNYSNTWKILEMLPEKPDIIHLHNLHGSYFDLRFLPVLSQNVPVLVTLHDAWLLSGHCAHSFCCEKWINGCGECPDLSIPPSIRRDSTTANWNRKRDLYSKSRLYVTTPSSWLMNKVNKSMLMNGVFHCRVIPNGVDLETFTNSDKILARKETNLPFDAKVILFSGCGMNNNVWRDKTLFDKVINALKNNSYNFKVIILLLGENEMEEKCGDVFIRSIPYQDQGGIIAKYYQSADLFVHPALEDTFPSVVLEAMACGTPVVATSVGGITEQIVDRQTGILVPRGDSNSMINEILRLLEKPDLCAALGEKSAIEARHRFGLKSQADDYLELYDYIISDWRSARKEALLLS